MRMTVSKKIKMSVLSSGNANKYKFLTSKDVLAEIDQPEKTATTKKFVEYSPLGKELKAQNDIAKKISKIIQEL